MGKIGVSSDEKLSAQYKEEMTKLQTEKERLQSEFAKKDKEFTDYMRQRVEEDKLNRQSKGDWEQKERKYKQEVSGLKSQIETEKSLRQTLESNLATLKDGSAKTMEMKMLQFAEREKQWNQER